MFKFVYFAVLCSFCGFIVVKYVFNMFYFMFSVDSPLLYFLFIVFLSYLGNAFGGNAAPPNFANLFQPYTS